MADEEKTLNSAETETPAEEPKGKKEKAPKESKADKQAARDAKKQKAQLQKEWEDSIIASKRVKREEMRRKLKRAMLFMLVVALIITSVVYIMLLFLDENNVRITASSSNKSKIISLSIDNEVWSPYLNGKGPEHMTDISYNPTDYNDEDTLPISKKEVRSILLNSEKFEPGTKSDDKYISFAFLLKNDGTEDCYVDCDMTLEYDAVRNLQNCTRVMWGTSFKNHPENTNVDIYAALSTNPRLYNTTINRSIWDDELQNYRRRTAEDGFVEYVAYPVGSDQPTFSMLEYEDEIMERDDYLDIVTGWYFETTPFYSNEYVFKYTDTLEAGDIMYCYVVIWIEGSDFDCVDSAIGGYVKLSINFNAY